jgi:hypothetical protein
MTGVLHRAAAGRDHGVAGRQTQVSGLRTAENAMITSAGVPAGTPSARTLDACLVSAGWCDRARVQ